LPRYQAVAILDFDDDDGVDQSQFLDAPFEFFQTSLLPRLSNVLLSDIDFFERQGGLELAERYFLEFQFATSFANHLRDSAHTVHHSTAVLFRCNSTFGNL